MPEVHLRSNYQDPRRWTGFDLDGTLAYASPSFDPEKIGNPIIPMKMLLYEYIARGKRCKIFTARVSLLDVPNDRGETGDEAFVARQHEVISAWLMENFGFDLEVTCIKDYLMEEIYDDRAWRVEMNSGKIVGQVSYFHELRYPPDNPDFLDVKTLPFRYPPDFSKGYVDPLKPSPFTLDLTPYFKDESPDVGKDGADESNPKG